MERENKGAQNADAAWLAYGLAVQAQELLLTIERLRLQQVVRRWQFVLDFTRKELSK